MVSGMAHEINNPAQAILSMAELIQEEDDPDTIKEFAADIVGYARHVSTVVRDFAGYARSAGRDGETEIDVAERLLEAVKMVRRGPHFGYVDIVTQFEAPAFLRARKGENRSGVRQLDQQRHPGDGRNRPLDVGDRSGRQMDRRDHCRYRPWHSGLDPSPKIFDPFFTTKELGKGPDSGSASCKDRDKTCRNDHGGQHRRPEAPPSGCASRHSSSERNRHDDGVIPL